VHVFFLQLRDENMEPLPGIEVGDIGTKVGENEVDIGYLRLQGARVPRKHMMEKRQHVTADGRYVKHGDGKSGNEKAAYLTMMGARVTMVAGSSVCVFSSAFPLKSSAFRCLRLTHLRCLNSAIS
jgi:acyl-CoA oxidase